MSETLFAELILDSECHTATYTPEGYILSCRRGQARAFTTMIDDAIDQLGDDYVLFPSDIRIGQDGYDHAILTRLAEP
ncbi:hypothetical protein [Brevundimonas sp. TWP1-2-1b1]|uniref:hypothetical protein n=1 Tax=unclassified Brevundimonas TaxID=2622653 RepID=UPI003CF7AA79